uniref:roundabout homolog 2-like isoform X2 n=1 Tax=Styela clava TaxID=7725 RepID=UPI001939FBAC|nr:roundabout homolog 2-like isoform X2 [Styela clava]
MCFRRKTNVTMQFVFLSALLIFGFVFEVGAEPEAAPGPSPIADPGRKSQDRSVKPVLTEEPTSQIAKRGGTADLYCRAEGLPKPQISWYKDGHLLRKNAKNILFMHNKIHLFNLRNSVAEGVYQCEAKNGAGTVRSQNVTLSISYIKEEFRVIPTDEVSTVGQNAIIKCEGPEGLPEPKITWKKDDKWLPTGTGRVRIENGDLVITGTRKSDDGQYKCVATNQAGTRESLVVLLTVLQPPQFTVTPEDVEVKEGQDVELACQVEKPEGETKPRIRWTKADGIVSGSRFELLGNGNLRITDIQAEDEGKYICNAGNQRTSKSVSATVTVHTKPEFIRVPKETMSVRVGATVKLTCSASGKPKPSILWHINDGANIFADSVSEDGSVTVNEAGELTLYNAKFTDTGRYTCQALSISGRVSADTQLTVVSHQSDINPPIIRRGPQNITAAYGSPVDLRCTTSAIATTKFDWMKGGSKIEPGSKYTITSGNLKIISAQNSDTGKYTCRATNDFGWSKWDVWVTVAEKGVTVSPSKFDATKVPEAPSAPTVTGSTTDSISLQWTQDTATGSTPLIGYMIEYYCQQCDVATWNRISAKITSSTFTVKDLTSGSSYVFLVRAVNQYGISDPSDVSEIIDTRGENPTTADEKEMSELRRKLLQISVRLTTVNPLSVSTSSGGIRLEWDSSANCDIIDGFKIYLQPVSVRNGARIVETASCYARNTEIKNLQSRVVYEIRIRPFKLEVMGYLSPIMLASPESEGTTPEAPILEIDSKASEGDNAAVISFSWTPPSSILPEYISRYTLRCYDKNKDYDFIRDVSDTSYTLDDLPKGRDYIATITFSTLLGEGRTSEKKEFSLEAGSAAEEDGLSSLMKNPAVLAGIGACVLLIIGIMVGVILYRRHKKNQKSRGLHGGRPGIPMDPFRDTQYSKGFTINFANPGGSNNNFDSDGSNTGNGNMYLQRQNMPGPHSVARNTTVSLNNSNGNVGTSLSPDMSDVRPVARQTSSFSYVTDQLTSMSSIPPQFSSPNSNRAPTQIMSTADLQLQLQQQQQYKRQISDSQTVLADEYSPQENLIDMNTPLEQNPNSAYFTRDSDLPPPPPSPPMSLKTSLSERTNRSRGSSKHSDRGSNHSGSRGRRSRERNRTFQPLERVPTDTDTGIDSPQQTPSPPRPADLRGNHSQMSSTAPQPRNQGAFSYPSSKQHNNNNGRRRNDGIAVEYSRMTDPNLGYLGGPSEGETESEVGGIRHARANNYHLSLPEEVRNSVAVSSVSMMNAYDSESDCGSSDGIRSRTSSVESLNMESASQVGMYGQQHAMSPNRPGQSAFVPINNQYNGGGNALPSTRPNFVKPKVPKKNHNNAQNQYNVGGMNGHQSIYPDPPQQGYINPKNPNLAPEQFLNRVNSASSSESSSYHQNTADSGMSAGVGSYGHNSLNSTSSGESGPKGHISRSRTTGSLSADQPPTENNAPPHFASVDRRYLPNSDHDRPEYQNPRGRQPAPQPRRPPRVDSFNKMSSKSPQRKDSQDSNLSLPPRDTMAYVDYETPDNDGQTVLTDNVYRTNDDDVMNEQSDESRIAFLAAKSVFAPSNGSKPVRGRHPELSDVPEVSTSDFCEDYSDRSQ